MQQLRLSVSHETTSHSVFISSAPLTALQNEFQWFFLPVRLTRYGLSDFLFSQAKKSWLHCLWRHMRLDSLELHSSFYHIIIACFLQKEQEFSWKNAMEVDVWVWRTSNEAGFMNLNFSLTERFFLHLDLKLKIPSFIILKLALIWVGLDGLLYKCRFYILKKDWMINDFNSRWKLR